MSNAQTGEFHPINLARAECEQIVSKHLAGGGSVLGAAGELGAALQARVAGLKKSGATKEEIETWIAALKDGGRACLLAAEAAANITTKRGPMKGQAA